MLETLSAVRFVDELEGGRNRPWLIEAERSQGEVVEVVVKLGSAECGVGGLVREAYCSMLAADLELPVAEPFVVAMSSEFVETLPREVRGRTKATLAFGVTYVPGMVPLQLAGPLTASLRVAAEEAITFDAGVVNADRLVSKPNCLCDGRKLLLIDHEMALHLAGRGWLVRDPWTPDALAHMSMGRSEHLFYRELKKSRPDQPAVKVDSFVTRLEAITSSRITEYREAIPPEWDQDGVPDEIAGFLRELIANARGLGREVEGLLS